MRITARPFVDEIGDYEGFFEDFRLKKAVNNHSVCEFKFKADEKYAKSLNAKVGEKISVFIADKKEIIFCGKIQKIAIERAVNAVYAEVFAMSLSADTDEKKYRRIFQNPDKTFGEVLNNESLSLTDFKVLAGEKIVAKKYENPIIQYDETDFEFIKKCAKIAKTNLWVMDTKERGGEARISDNLDIELSVKTEDIISASFYREKGNKGVKITTQKYLPLGSLITFENERNKYIVKSLDLEYERGSFKFKYELTENFNSDDKRVFQPTVKLKARVKDNKDPKNLGRIQVDFLDIDDKDKNKSWIPYRTNYSGKNSGIVFIPDVNDLVEVFVGEDLYCVSALRENNLVEECKNIEDKFIGNNFLQRIIWKKESLELKSADTSIILDKDKIELKLKDSRFLMDKDKIELVIKGSKINLTDKDIIISTDKSKSEIGENITLNSGDNLNMIAKKTEIKSSSDTEINSGGNLNIKASKIKMS